MPTRRRRPPKPLRQRRPAARRAASARAAPQERTTMVPLRSQDAIRARSDRRPRLRGNRDASHMSIRGPRAAPQARHDPFPTRAILRAPAAAGLVAVGCDHPAVRGAMIAFMAERSPRSAGFLDETDRQKVAARTTAGSAPTTMALAALGVVLAGERLAASDPLVSVGGSGRARPRCG